MATRHDGDVSESRCRETNVSKMRTKRRPSTSVKAKCKSRASSAGPLGTHEKIDQIKIKEGKGSFSKRAPAERQRVNSLRRELLGMVRTELTSNCRNDSWTRKFCAIESGWEEEKYDRRLEEVALRLATSHPMAPALARH